MHGLGYGYGSGFDNNWGYGNPGYYNSYSYYPGWRSNWGYYPGSNYAWGNSWNTYPGGVYGYQPSDYGAGRFASNLQSAQPYTSFYGGDNGYDERNVPSKAALISVRIAPDAKVVFSGHETQQRGNFREFVTPALTDNQTYSYELRTQWNENGQTIDRTRKVLVHPGDRIHIDFTRDGLALNQMTPEATAIRSQSGYDADSNQNLPKDQLNRNGEIIPAPGPHQSESQRPGATSHAAPVISRSARRTERIRIATT